MPRRQVSFSVPHSAQQHARRLAPAGASCTAASLFPCPSAPARRQSAAESPLPPESRPVPRRARLLWLLAAPAALALALAVQCRLAADPAWLAWHGGAVVKLAQALYEERELPSGHLDAAR